MKITKRIKKWIIQSAIFSGVFFLILLSTLAIFAYPQIKEISGKKQELERVYNKYNTTLVSWLPYTEFRSLLLSWEVTDYSKVLLQNVTENFYTTHFTNTGSQLYTEFLDDMKISISETKSSQEYLDKDKRLNVFLPTYNSNNSSWNTVFWESVDENGQVYESKTLSDFYFINYIENLLYSFNLSYDGEIGVWELINVDDNTIENKQEVRDLLEESIFSIPLSFSLVWRKSDIVDFLHYFENVAKIKIDEDGFIVPNDNFIAHRIEWSSSIGTYNIYENQLADISSLSAKEYPNSSVKTTDSLIYAMKTLQAKEKYEIDVELQFYVAGVPGYKMQSYINTLFENYAQFTSTLKKDTQKFVSQKFKYTTSDELTAIQSLQNLESLLISLEEDMNALRKESVQTDNIETSYNVAREYNKKLEKMNNVYQEQLKILLK